MDFEIDHSTLHALSSAAVRTVVGDGPEAWKFSGLPASIYHSVLDWQSSSSLKRFLDSPATYLQRLLNPSRPSSAQQLGSLIHTLVLEPAQLGLQYEVLPEVSRAHHGRDEARERITEIQLHQARVIAERVLERHVLGKPLQDLIREGAPEESIFFRDPSTRTPCRIPPDLRHQEALIDLKTTRHGNPRDFQRSALELHYDLQAYMYCLGDCEFRASDSAKPFIFVVAQSTPPFSIFVLRAGESFLENGRAKYERAIALLRACAEVDYWPDQSCDDVMEIEHWQAFERG